MIKFFTIRAKIFWTVLLISILPLLAIMVFGKSEIERALIVSQGGKFTEFASNASQKVDQLLYTRKTDLEGFAKNQALNQLINSKNYDQVSEQLRLWKRDYGVYAALYFVNNDGVILAASESTAVGRSVVNETWYQHLSNPAEYAQTLVSSDDLKVTASVGELAYDSLTANYSVNFSIPIFSQSKNNIDQSGLLISRLNWSELYNVTSSVRVHDSNQDRKNYAVLINSKGQLLSGPGFLLNEESRAKEMQVLYAINYKDKRWSAADAALRGKKGYLVQSGDAFNSLLVGYASTNGYLDFPGLGWAIMIIQDTSETFAVLNQLYYIIATVFACLFIAAFGSSWALAAKFRKRLQTIFVFIDSIRKGYLSERLQLGGSDELADLAKKMNSATESIQSLVEQERSARINAEASNNKKGIFLGDLAEELKRPINNVLEMNDALLVTQLSPDQKTILSSMRKLLTVLIGCANEMRDISRIETGQISLENKPFNLRSVIEEIVEIMGVSASLAGRKLIISYSNDAASDFLSDAVRIHQVITNILSYMLKQTSYQMLYISVVQEPSTSEFAQLQILISDIDYSQQKDKLKFPVRVGEPADRVIDTQAVSEELSTSKRLAELMGGEVGSFSSQNTGATVWLNLKLRLQ
ncbi:MAG: hypothetical protein IT292_05480 [Deltaproteobacteria bacterium]|nr:hypothetical protein [Deltaproteobacteria bacterium]